MSADAPARKPVQRSITEEEAERIVALYKETRSAPETAYRSGRSITAVRSLLGRRKLYKRNLPHAVDEPEAKRIIAWFRETDSVRETARLSGRSARTVRNVLQRYYLLPSQRPMKPPSRYIWPAEAERIAELYRETGSVLETAARCGRGYPAVRRVLERKRLYSPELFRRTQKIAALDEAWARNRLTLQQYIIRYDRANEEFRKLSGAA